MNRLLPIIISFILLIASQDEVRGQSSRNVPGTETGDRIIKLYPNPATTYITFDLQKGYERGMSIQIYSFLGKRMHEVTNASQKTVVDLNEFNRGLYMYHLLDASGKVVESGKFQVSK